MGMMPGNPNKYRGDLPSPQIHWVKCRDCPTMLREPITGGMTGIQGRCDECHEKWMEDFIGGAGESKKEEG